MSKQIHEQNMSLADELLPDSELIEKELKREKKKTRYRNSLMSVVVMIIAAAAAAVLVANLWMPVLEIYGTSMSPTLRDGEIVLTVKDSRLERGDIIAFRYSNKVLVKRVIGVSGDWINIDQDGNVFVNDELQVEPYILRKDDGDPDITLPYQVPEGKYFVIGDNRKSSADSRHSTVGCVGKEEVVGRITFCVWPLGEFGIIR